MAFLLPRTPWLRQAWEPLTFPNTNFERVPSTETFEEEFRLYKKSQSEDLQLENELDAYKRISEASSEYPGRETVRELLASFDIIGPDGFHRGMLHRPLWECLEAFLYRTPDKRFLAPLLAFVLRRLFLALEFLHTECKVIHTNINSVNIIFATGDDTVFTAFEEEALEIPCPRKIADGRTIYQSRQHKIPTLGGLPILCDFGSAEFGDKEHPEVAQPQIYRSPEVILEVPWSYEIDIWNGGCMDLFQGRGLFTGQDPELQTYRSRAHPAEIIALLGPPPQSLLQSGKDSHRFFTEIGFRNDIPIPERTTLEEQETRLDGRNRHTFLAMMRKILQWDPSKRGSAKELAEDDWIVKNVGDKEARQWRLIVES
ncbi:CMGC SRPK kinase [Fusarium heterosporum]|uniref:CMGC SRPK kinase n=1 Tax=Fusarium heterosporum TaxID=42747 RepID=A0A8H5WF23_FUSHE|nr:CMGC SRPK kinase [Fusarium heterosporum]